MSKAGVIFDLDGVIVDTAKYHYLAWKKLANSLGIDFDEKMNEQLKGVSRVRSLQKILSWGNKSLDEQAFEQCMERKNNDYLNYIKDMNQEEILPGVIELLEFLRKKNIPFSLGSASKNAKTILRATRIMNWFVAIVDGNEVSKAKPDPEVFLIAAERMGIEPSECIVFEDSTAGVQAANHAGMLSIGIGDKNVLYEADYVFSDFTEIDFKFIESIIEQ